MDQDILIDIEVQILITITEVDPIPEEEDTMTGMMTTTEPQEEVDPGIEETGEIEEDPDTMDIVESLLTMIEMEME